jgi:transposase
MLAKVRRMYLRQQLSKREIARRTGLSRNTIDTWLKDKPDVLEPVYPARQVETKLDAYADTLRGWLTTNQHRTKRDRRTVHAMYEELTAMGYRGSYGRVAAFARRFRDEQSKTGGAGGGRAFVPMKYPLGDAFQFDWSTEYAFVGGQRCRLDVAHTKLCASRAFWLTAYPTQSHEMLFDAHARAFAAFGGVPTRGIYDNMKTAVDRVGRGKQRTINARFAAMASHYLFEPEFCNVASGWEKGIVEKNVLDRRRQIWREAMETRWSDLDTLNDWLGKQCQMLWAEAKHPDWPELTVADVLVEERPKLMALPRPFDGYVEYPVRVSSTSLIHLDRNRYSVPTAHANRMVSLRLYPTTIDIVSDGCKVATHARAFARDQTYYDWRHYIDLVVQKPGALRNGAPFATMPTPLRELQKHLLVHTGGDRVMATLLAAIPAHGLDAILSATEAALAVGKPSAEHVLYLLAQLKDRAQPAPPAVETTLVLNTEPVADMDRYDRLRMNTVIKSVVLSSPILTAMMTNVAQGINAISAMSGGTHVR